MVKKNQKYLLCALLIAFSSLLTAVYLLKLRPQRAEKARIVAINKRVAQNFSRLPPPPPIPGTVPHQQIAAPPPQPAAAATLTQAQLEPLRAAFKATRSRPSQGQRPKEKTILLTNRVIEVPEERDLPTQLARDQILTQRETLPYVVHFGQPITAEMRQRLEGSGALLRGYLPHYAFLTELSAAALREVANNPEVRYVTEFLPEDKIQPFLGSLTETQPASETVQLAIQTLDPKDTESIAALVANLGGVVNRTTRLPAWGLINATIALSEIPALARCGDVQWIEEFVPPQLLNDSAALPSHLDAVTVQNEWYLTGRDQIIGHGDTGLDTGNEATIHPDFKGQIVAIFDLANGRIDAADYNGHGTHTAGSICGSGASSGGQYKGIAYDAKLVSQCLVNKDTGAFTGIYDLYAMYMQSYLNGATIHSDSWGSAVYGEYDSFSRETDLFAWSHPNFLPVFAAGNSGKDGDNDGIVDSDSLTSPGSAKNVLTVGAAESDRPIKSEGYRSRRYGTVWPSSFKTNPIKDDYISWSATTTPYQQGMAAFSSRGPTDDNRIKPEVCAPGTDIISTRSSVPGASALWGVLPSNNAYCYSGGTSMATPLTAGSAALIRQYMIERAGIPNPSAALIKATMIGGSRSLAPGQYGTGSAQEIPFTSPNFVEGWGQPELAQMLHPQGLMIKLIDGLSPVTGGTNLYQITVAKAGYPLDIVMSFQDYPGTAGGGTALINDLDLNVVTPGASTLFPNNGIANDDCNTVECIRLNAAAAGVYTLKVIGANVVVNNGAIAIYVRGALDETPIIVHENTLYYDSALAPYPIDFKVQSLNLLTNNQVRLYYNTGTANVVTGAWQSVIGTWSSNAIYRALIPHHPKNTTLRYYIQVSNEMFNVSLPKNAVASNSFFTMHLGTPTRLGIDGSPSHYGTVSPDYGTNSVLSGQIFTAIAMPQTVSVNERLAADGWSGSGDIASVAGTNSLTTSIQHASTLTWNWDTQYRLTRKRYFKGLDALLSDGTFWHWKDRVVPDQSAKSLLSASGVAGGTVLYAFYGWSLNDARWPNATAPSLNPCSGLVMTGAYTLQANYMMLYTDLDSDGIYDWWEKLYFGNNYTANDPDADLDGDLWSNRAEALDNTNPFDPNSVPTPPVITAIPLAPFQSARPPWNVTAEIKDNFIVASAVLQWREKGEILWQEQSMSYVSNDLFTCELNPAAHGAKRVDYRIVAADLIGTYDPSFSVTSALYSVVGDYDTPWLQITPETMDIVKVSNQATNFCATVVNLAGPDLIWTGSLATASETFAASHPGWQHSGTNDLWHISTYRTWNGDPVWYCGSKTLHQYPSSCHASLSTPEFIVGRHGVLSFRYWADFEEDTKENYYWDGGVVMISTNSGSTFSIIEPVAGYNAYIVPNPASPFVGDQPCFGGMGTGWESVLVDLAPYVGQSVIFRFEFGSDEYVASEGWYVGGVTVLSSEPPQPPWLTKTGTWGGVLADGWLAEPCFEINPLLMGTNSEHIVCLRVDSNDSTANPIVDLTLRRGFAITGETSGHGRIFIDDPIIFRDESALVTIQAEYGSYITNITINGVWQPGDYGFEDTSRVYTLHPVTNDTHFAVEFDWREWNLLINSALGAPSPSSGNHQLTHGSEISAFVTTPVLDDNPMIRYSANGYVLIGADPVSENTGALSFVLTNDTELTWLWSTNYQLKAISTGNGVVVPEQGWYIAGSYSCTTGYPSSYHHFQSWNGNTNNSVFSGLNNSHIITLPMNGPRSISATFAINLTPTHGVPELWLAGYGFTGNFEAAAEGDHDSDGMYTWQEWHADTDPTNTLSLLKLTRVQPTPGAVELTWIGGIHRTQRLQRATTPAGPWIDIYTNLPPTPVMNSIQLPYGSNPEFFRVLVP